LESSDFWEHALHPVTEQPIPRIVRAALGIRNLNLEIEKNRSPASGRAGVGYSLEHRNEVRKRNDTPVGTDIFLTSAYSHVSALIYSPADWVNTPFEPGAEFVVVHNENATTRLPHGWLSAGDEYWL
jgi:hypothetical protein